MSGTLSDPALDQIFRAARSHNAWADRPVPVELLQRVYELMKFGPTSANASPARILFVASRAAKLRLEPFMSAANRAKTMAAPVTAIIGHDLEFYEKLPQLYPRVPGAKSWFTGSAGHAEREAFRNGTLQAGYFIVAARALGLDAGPMSGFDAEGVNREFFPDGKVKANFLCNLGYGDPAALHPRGPRLSFDEACKVL